MKTVAIPQATLSTTSQECECITGVSGKFPSTPFLLPKEVSILKQKSTLQSREYFYLLGGWESNPAFANATERKENRCIVSVGAIFQIAHAASPL